MSFRRQIRIALKAIWELGPQQVGDYILYTTLLRSGNLRWRTKNALKAAELESEAYSLAQPFNLPARDPLSDLLAVDGRAGLLAQADEILSGKVRLLL